MPTLGLSMIVKNEVENLRACLESVRGVVSQVVVVDTGSTDGTVEIAREGGAEVFSVAWENDFAKARNAALAAMTTDWVLVLDADEELDPAAGQRIPALLERMDMGGYIVPIRNYLSVKYGRNYDRVAQPNDHRIARARNAPAYAEHEYCRLFRRHPEICFEGCVHEVVEHRVLATGLKLGRANFMIHHFGQLANHERIERKRRWYHDLARIKVQERPNDSSAWIELGMQEYENLAKYEEALRCFERALALNPNERRVWTFIGIINVELGRYREALMAFHRAEGARYGDGLREQFRGDALHNLGYLKEARQAYRKALKLSGPEPGVESKLGYTEVRLGLSESGLAKLQRAVRLSPERPDCHERLVKAYVCLDQLAEAANAADAWSDHHQDPKTFLRAASLRAQLRQWDRVEALLNRGLRLFPDSNDIRSAYQELRRRQAASTHSAPQAQPTA